MENLGPFKPIVVREMTPDLVNLIKDNIVNGLSFPYIEKVTPLTYLATRCV